MNKMDEIRLRIANHKRMMDCNIMIFTETWLNSGVPNSTVELTGRNFFRADRSADNSGKTRGLIYNAVRRIHVGGLLT